MNTLPDLPPGATARIDNLIADAVQPRKRRFHRRTAVIAAAGAFLVMGTGATGVAVAASLNRPTTVYCFEEASTTSKYVEVPMTPAYGTAPSSDRFEVAVDNCAGAWLKGAFSYHHRPISGLEAPALILCKRSDNNAAAFPDDAYGGSDPTTFCKNLGLATAY